MIQLGANQFAMIKRRDPTIGWLPEWSVRLHVGEESTGGKSLYGITIRLGMWDLRLSILRPIS